MLFHGNDPFFCARAAWLTASIRTLIALEWVSDACLGPLIGPHQHGLQPPPDTSWVHRVGRGTGQTNAKQASHITGPLLHSGGLEHLVTRR
ncbi:hypothetical protein LEMLEM_LOCUS12335 [Lemmus lemmus]